jgi:uncharacterized phage-associated protein
MPYSPRIVANALIRKALEHGEKLTHLKLQKLVFFLHGWHLATTGRPALEGENVEAWPYGPVVPSLYHELKHYGSRGIEGYLQEPDMRTGAITSYVPPPEDQHMWQLVDYVWRRYGRFSAIELSNMTHKPDSPWWRARATSPSAPIPDESIRAHFVHELEEANKAQRAANG